MDGQTTVCLLLEEKKVVARGLSICSRWDDWDGALGRKHALARAHKARGMKQDCDEIKLMSNRTLPVDIVKLSLTRDRFGDFKGYFQPQLTPTEYMIVNRR